MTRTRTYLSAILTLIAVGLALPATAAHAADRPQVTVSAHEAHLVSPIPGHSREWTFDVTNNGRASVDLQLSIESAAGGLLEGPAASAVSFAAGGAVLGSFVGTATTPTRLTLPALAAGQTITITGALALPASADNSYQLATADVRWSIGYLTTSQGPASPPPSGALPFTGGTFTPEWGVVALAAVLAGWFLVAAARRRRDREEASR